MLVDIDEHNVVTLLFPAASSPLIDAEFCSSFDRACRAIDSNQNIRAVVIGRAAPSRHFCAGVHRTFLKQLSQKKSQEDVMSVLRQLSGSLLRLRNLQVPLIACVKGTLAGGGLTIALACDLIVADDTINIKFVNMQLGMGCLMDMSQRLVDRIGRHRTFAYMTQSTSVRGRNTLDVGLVDVLCQTKNVVEEGKAIARLYGRHPARGVKYWLEQHRSEHTSLTTADRYDRDDHSLAGIIAAL